MWRRISAAVLIVVLVLIAIAAYRNVFSDDTAVRAQADKLARETAGCGSNCGSMRLEGSRGVLAETFTFRFAASTVTVSCRRPYVAFGAYACTATKH
ncbi:MAG TPA: hypothetical protein VIV40_22225 [Kofleriaceae bacterium]